MTAPRVLGGPELLAANVIYEELAFQPSDPECDITLGILDVGAPIALGRLQRHPGDALEAGGFWVHDDRRGSGLARALVRAVFALAPADEDVWCIPFRHLTPFYRSFGLINVDPRSPLPEGIRDKLKICSTHAVEGTFAETDLLLRPART